MPDASEYTRIKRLQTVITDNNFSTKPNRIPAYGIRSFPINVLRPGKLINTGQRMYTLQEVIANIVNTVDIINTSNRLYFFLNNVSKITYTDIFSKISHCNVLPLSSNNEFIVLPEYDSTDTANITLQPSGYTKNVYIMYPNSTIKINNALDVSYTGSNYYYKIGNTTGILLDGDSIPGYPGVRFKRGSVVLTYTPIPSPFTFFSYNQLDLTWPRGVYLNFIHPNIKVNSTQIKKWKVYTEDGFDDLPQGFLLDENTGAIYGSVPTDFSLNSTNTVGVSRLIKIQSQNTNINYSWVYSIAFVPELRIKEITTPATSGYSNELSNTLIVIPTDTDVSFSVFEVDPNYPGTLNFYQSSTVEWAINPSLPSGLLFDELTGIISGRIQSHIDKDFRVGAKDIMQTYSSDYTDSKYFTLRAVKSTIEFPSSTTIICKVNELTDFDIRILIDPLDLIRTPYTFSTKSILPSNVILKDIGLINFNSPTVEGTYPIQIDCFDAYNTTRRLTHTINIVIDSIGLTLSNFKNISIPYAVSTLTYGGGVWLIGDSYGAIAYTLNPKNSLKLAIRSGSAITSTAYGDGFWVACDGGQIFYTDDINRPFIETSSIVPFFSINYVNRVWIAGDYNGNIWYSNNITENWTSKAISQNTCISDIYYGNGYWVATDQSRKCIWYSTSLSGSWTLVDMGYSEPNCITYANGYWVMGSINGNIRYTTNPSSQWTEVVFEDSSIRSIVCVNNRWIVADLNGKLWHTTNLSGTWTEISFNGSYIYGMEYGNNMLVFADVFGKLWYSEIV